MNPQILFYAPGPVQWRAWLRKNHGAIREVWLVFYKKHTGKPGVTYGQAVEEALCWGWIDSIIKRLDDERYAQKFTPRANAAKWSASNILRARALILAGRMLKPGLAVISPDVLKIIDSGKKPATRPKNLPVPAELAAALKADPAAGAFFDSLPPSHRRNYIGWISSGKRAETRAKRAEEAAGLLARGQRLGLK
jgi:uncharacterized protein YdeI (YjbR/CyaY-like superfamily)